MPTFFVYNEKKTSQCQSYQKPNTTKISAENIKNINFDFQEKINKNLLADDFALFEVLIFHILQQLFVLLGLIPSFQFLRPAES